MPPEPPEITPELLQQNPVLAVLLALFSLFMLGGAMAAIGAWSWLIWRLRTGKPILESVPWQPRVWGLADLAIVLIGFYFLQVGFFVLGVPVFRVDVEAIRGGEAPPMAFNAWLSLANLAAVVLAIVWIRLRFQVPIAHLGWTRPLGKELVIGGVAGFVVIPLVYLISAAVNLSFQEEYSHPILEALQSEATVTSFLMACFVAVVAAPISEEFAFRVLLQGWLQSLPFSSKAQAILGRIPVADCVHLPPTGDDVPDGSLQTVLLAESAESREDSSLPPLAGLVPGASPAASENDDQASPLLAETPPSPPAWAPLISGTLFGLAHWGYGLSFVPLIVFGIALGFVYRARNSIWPCIVMHVMLNATSMIGMGVQLMLLRAQSAG